MDLVIPSILFALAAFLAHVKRLEVLSALVVLVTIGYITGTGPWWSYIVVPSAMLVGAALGILAFGVDDESLLEDAYVGSYERDYGER